MRPSTTGSKPVPSSHSGKDDHASLVTGDDRLQPTPSPVPTTDLLPANLPEAWAGETTTAQTIADALSAKTGKPLPWPTVRAAIDGALQGRLPERTEGSGPWPCDYSGATSVVLKTRGKTPTPTTTKPVPTPPDVLFASSDLQPGELQELGDQIGEIRAATIGYDFKVMVRIEIGTDGKRPPADVVDKINAKLGVVSKSLELA
jgi:hypothetical protein